MVPARVVPLVLAGLAGFVVYQSLPLPLLDTNSAPGPGFMPTLIAGLALVLAARWVVVERQQIAFGDLRRAAIIPLGLGVYALAFERAGFVISSAALLFLLLLVFGQRAIARSVVLAIVGAVSAYALFAIGLRLRLPPDPWGLWL